MLRTLSGRIQLAAFTILVAFALTLLTAFVLKEREALLLKVGSDLAEHLFVNEARINQNIDILRRDTLFLSEVPPVSGIMRAAANGGFDRRDGNSAATWRKRLREIFRGFISANPECLRARFIGVADGGRELVRVERGADGVVEVADAALRRRDDQDYVGGAVSLEPGRVYLSEIRRGQDDEDIMGSGRPTLHLHAATPVYSPTGQVFGAIVIDWDIGALLDAMADRRQPESSVYVADQARRYLVRQNGALGDEVDIVDGVPLLAVAFDLGAPASTGFREAQVGETPLHFIARRVHFDPQRRDRFLVIAYVLPDEPLMAELRRPIGLAAVGGGLLAGAILAGLVLLIRRAFAPLARLTAAAAAVSQGAREVDLPARGWGDVATLAKAFRGMLANIARKERALSKLNADLEKKVQERTADLDRAQQVGRIGSWRIDTRRNEATWSAENYRLFGIAPGTPITYETFLAAVHANDREYVDRQWHAALQGEPYDIEHRIVVAGETKWVRTRAEIERDAHGEVVGGFGTTQDIDELKRAETALAEAMVEAEQANRAKSVFLANMSHEIRTPLHVIIGLAHLLRRDLSDATQRHRVDQVCSTSEHLLAVINSILDLSKIEADRLALDSVCFRMDEVIDKVLAIVAEQARDKGLQATTEVAPELGGMVLRGDALRLAQILINLGNNAVKFTAHGEVKIAIAMLDETERGVQLRFLVQDTGSGIAPDDQARLFQAFEQADNATTREHGGTGLGLVISERLVRLMGGTIRLQSTPGCGSTFSFDIVLPRGDSATDTAAAPAAPATLHGKRVLVAEDHRISQDIILEMLEDLGCEVDLADDGVDAVDYACSNAYDLILMDMQMPRMDGLAAARAIRELPEHRDTPIIAVTANAFAEDRQRCLDAGMNGHIGKPVTPATLAAALGHVLPLREAPPAMVDGPLAQALANIPGLAADNAFLRSPAQLAEYPDLLRRYLAMHGDDMARLERHLAAGERDAAQTLAHQLKGVSGFIGAQRVASLAAELHAALRHGADPHGMAPQMSACAAELASLACAVQALPSADCCAPN